MFCTNPHIQTKHPPILDRGEELVREIRIGKYECVKYLFFPDRDGAYERRFFVEEGAVFEGSGVIVWANIDLKMSVFVEGSSSESLLSILSLAKDDSLLSVEGKWVVPLWLTDIKLRVDQTNILLGSSARVKGRPILEVATDSIEGGHSCKIHQISGEELFYLQSHGIEAKSAEAMLLEAEITKHTRVMEEQSDIIREEVLFRIQKPILDEENI